jgi:hypothetical protein
MAAQCHASHSAHGHSTVRHGGPWLAWPWPTQPSSGGGPKAGDGVPAHCAGARGGTTTVAQHAHGDAAIVGGEVG